MKKNRIICTTLEEKYTKGVTPIINELSEKNDNLLIIDNNSYIYDNFKEKLESKYNLVNIDFTKEPDSTSNKDLLEIVYNYYKEGKVSTSLDYLNDFASVIFKDDSIDPFWNESAASIFIGTVLYMFKNNEPVSFINVYNKVEVLSEKENDKLRKYIEENPTDSISLYLDGLVKMPTETKGGVISTFNQKLRNIALRMQKFNIDINLNSDNNAYIIKDYAGDFSKEARLIYTLIKRVSTIHSRHLNIVLPNIDTYEKMDTFKTEFNAGPSMDVTYYLVTSSIDYLKYKYSNLIEAVSDITIA